MESLTHEHTIHRSSADRVYECDDPAALKELFKTFGFRHYPGLPDSLYSDRWVHVSPQGKTVLTLFRSGRLTLLGPAVPRLDALCEVAG